VALSIAAIFKAKAPLLHRNGGDCGTGGTIACPERVEGRHHDVIEIALEIEE